MLGTLAAPTLNTQRLILRGWRSDDCDAYAALLAKPESARFTTRRGRPYSSAQAWAEMCFFVGHWQMPGYGMFVVKERLSDSFVGRVGALQPKGWPGYEIAWALTASASGKGYATGAAKIALTWSFETIGIDRIISVIHPENQASRRVAERLGEKKTDEQFSPFGEPCDVWEITRKDLPQ